MVKRTIFDLSTETKYFKTQQNLYKMENYFKTSAAKLFLIDCLNNAVDKLGYNNINDIKKEALKAFKQKGYNLSFFDIQETFKNYFY